MHQGALTFWEGHEGELTTFAVYAVGIALYALLTGALYLVLSRRDLRLREVTHAKSTTRFLFAFPFLTFAMSLILALALFFLAKNRTVEEILLLSTAVVASVRVTAYIRESVAEDLAKTMPLGLLGVLLVDAGFVSLGTPFERIASLPGHLDLMAVYLVAVIVLEVVLRVLWLASGGRGRAERRQDQAVLQRVQR